MLSRQDDSLGFIDLGLKVCMSFCGHLNTVDLDVETFSLEPLSTKEVVVRVVILERQIAIAFLRQM